MAGLALPRAPSLLSSLTGGGQPALASAAKSRICSALGVSEPYSSAIQAGKRVPHPRHWKGLAQLVGLAPNVQTNPVDAATRGPGRGPLREPHWF